nr:hypothetical protein [uncultured Novosphingobium sp.]
MRLIFVHGIKNEHRSSQHIIDEWLDGLAKVLSAPHMEIVRGAKVSAPYYGDILLETMSARVGRAEAIAQGGGDVSSDEAAFYLQALEDFAPAVGVTETDIRSQAGATVPVEQGLPHDRRFLALLRAIESISPDKGRLVLKLLPQAFTYLFRKNVTDAVETVVRPSLTTGDPAVVVAHSLGTIVTYKLLRENPSASANFYLTLGSPLAVRAVQNAIGPAFERPAGVVRWLNGLDPNDAVTIGRALKENADWTGVENVDDIENGSADPHSIAMYLRDRRIADAIVRALGT